MTPEQTTESSLTEQEKSNVKEALGILHQISKEEIRKHSAKMMAAYAMNLVRMVDHMKLDELTIGFEVGKSYLSLSGRKVKIKKASRPFNSPYACVMGDDKKWRYNRLSDLGRCTGTAFDMSNPDNLLMPAIDNVCPRCFSPTIKVTLHGLPMYRCTGKVVDEDYPVQHCNNIFGFWSFIQYFRFTWPHAYVQYNGSYWKHTFNRLLNKPEKT